MEQVIYDIVSRFGKCLVAIANPFVCTWLIFVFVIFFSRRCWCAYIEEFEKETHVSPSLVSRPTSFNVLDLVVRRKLKVGGGGGGGVGGLVDRAVIIVKGGVKVVNR